MRYVPMDAGQTCSFVAREGNRPLRGGDFRSILEYEHVR
jgi:hypothetical protein